MIRDTTSHSFYWSNRKLLGKEEAEGSLGDLGSANRYAYANDDPVNLVDTSGKYSFWCNLTIFFTLFGVGTSIGWAFGPGAAIIYGIAAVVASLTGIGLAVGIILFTGLIAAIGIGYAILIQQTWGTIQETCSS